MQLNSPEPIFPQKPDTMDSKYSNNNFQSCTKNRPRKKIVFTVINWFTRVRARTSWKSLNNNELMIIKSEFMGNVGPMPSISTRRHWQSVYSAYGCSYSTGNRQQTKIATPITSQSIEKKKRKKNCKRQTTPHQKPKNLFCFYFNMFAIINSWKPLYGSSAEWEHQMSDVKMKNST